LNAGGETATAFPVSHRSHVTRLPAGQSMQPPMTTSFHLQAGLYVYTSCRQQRLIWLATAVGHSQRNPDNGQAGLPTAALSPWAGVGLDQHVI